MNKTCEQFLLDQLKVLSEGDQWALASRDGQTIVVNTYSLDEFVPYRLASQHFHKESKAYELRKLYALPNTPKIILVDNLSSDVLLLVQKGQFPLQKLITHFQQQYHCFEKGELELVLQVVSAVQMLHKKYGYFQITQTMIRASKTPSLLIWIHDNEAENTPLHPISPISSINLTRQLLHSISPMHLMLQSLLQFFKSKLKNSCIEEILSNKRELTFEAVKRDLNIAIKDQSSSNYTIFSRENEIKRRFTEQKVNKIPKFLLEKDRSQICNQSYNSVCGILDNKNNKSSVTFTQMHKYQIKNETNQTDNIQKKQFNKKHKVLEVNAVKLNNQRSPMSHFKQQNDNLKTMNIQPVGDRDGKKNALIWRQSEKTFVINKNLFQKRQSRGSNNGMNLKHDEANKQNKSMFNHSSIIVKKSLSPFYKESMNKQCVEQQKSSHSQQHAKRDHPIKIVRNKINRNTHRSPSIIDIFGNNIGTETSLNSPSSEFIKEVDNILGSVQITSEANQIIEGQLNEILFD